MFFIAESMYHTLMVAAIVIGATMWKRMAKVARAAIVESGD